MAIPASFVTEMNDLKTKLMEAARQLGDPRQGFKPITGALASVLKWLRDNDLGCAHFKDGVELYRTGYSLLEEHDNQIEAKHYRLPTEQERATADDLIAYLRGEIGEMTPALLEWSARLKEAKAEDAELRELGEVDF